MKAVRKVEKFESSGFIPVNRQDIPPYPMTLPFNWRVDPYRDANWCFQLQTLRYLMVYIEAYKETNDESYIKTLLEWIENWWEDSRNEPGNFTWHDMATGIRGENIYKIANVLKETQMVSPAWFREMVLEHVRILRGKGFIRTGHNHGFYALHGLMCLSKLVGTGMRTNIEAKIRQDLQEILYSQFDENFVHKEHSPHYHILVVEALERYKKTGLYDEFKILNEFIDGANSVKKNFYLPDGREIPFGDTDNDLREDRSAVEVNSDDSGYDIFNKSGYLFIKKGISYICLTNSFHSNIHKHFDNLSLIAGFDGQDVFLDPGKYKYSNNDERSYVLSSCAHNVLKSMSSPWGSKDLIFGSRDFEIVPHPAVLIAKGSLQFSPCSRYDVWDRFVFLKEGRYLAVYDNMQSDFEDIISTFNLSLSSSFDVVDGEVLLHFPGLTLYCQSKSLRNGVWEDNDIEMEDGRVSPRYGSLKSTNRVCIGVSERSFTIFKFDRSVEWNEVFSECFDAVNLESTPKERGFFFHDHSLLCPSRPDSVFSSVSFRNKLSSLTSACGVQSSAPEIAVYEDSYLVNTGEGYRVFDRDLKPVRSSFLYRGSSDVGHVGVFRHNTECIVRLRSEKVVIDFEKLPDVIFEAEAVHISELFFLGDTHPEFGHLISEGLSRAWAFRRYLNSSMCLWFHGFSKNNGLVDSLYDLLGVGEEVKSRKIKKMAQGKIIKCNIIYLPQPLMFLGGEYNDYINRVWDGIARRAVSKYLSFGLEKIYLSRRRVANRVCNQEDDIVSFLNGRGVKEIFPEEYSLAEQVGLVARAKYVITLSGSAVHLAQFMSGGSNLAVICTQEHIIPDVIKIAKIRNIRLEVFLFDANFNRERYDILFSENYDKLEFYSDLDDFLKS